MVYVHAFTARKAALFELLEALTMVGPVYSFPWLSTSPTCQRQWPSLYQAVEEGQINHNWLRAHLAGLMPEGGVCHWALDCTSWLRTHAGTLPDRQYVYRSTPLASRGTVDIGYSYSLLDWVEAADQSWTLSVDLVRVPSSQTEWEVGIEQVRRLSQARQGHAGLDIVAADAKYGNHKFLYPLRDQGCGLVVALRRDRVLYRAPRADEQARMGRRRKHGQRFAFKDAATWASRMSIARGTMPAGERWSYAAGMGCTSVPRRMRPSTWSKHGSAWSGSIRLPCSGWPGKRPPLSRRK